MKKLHSLLLAAFLCVSLVGCLDMEPSPDSETLAPITSEEIETLPPLSSEEMETIVFEDSESVSGQIIEKPVANVLLISPNRNYLIEQWGETVYVLTDQANEWEIGQEVQVLFTIAHRPNDPDQPVRIIAENVEQLMLFGKPILYFYPQTPTVCSAKITLGGALTCTYPDHGEDGWKDFTAYPDGTLVFPNGKEYYALYWEGVHGGEWDFSHGFCVRGEDTAAFLEWALAEQGLSAREANEFIVYWLPLMQENPYNVISFQTEAYTSSAALAITPTPDSLLRVFMAYYPTDTAVDIPPQTFESFVREGFTVVEWGGSLTQEP